VIILFLERSRLLLSRLTLPLRHEEHYIR